MTNTTTVMKQTQSSYNQTQTLQRPVDSDTDVKATDGEDFGAVSLKDNEVPPVPQNSQKPNDQANNTDVSAKQQDEESTVAIGGQSTGAINESEDDTRKNVNADPNLIQGNLLGTETTMDNQYDQEAATNTVVPVQEKDNSGQPSEQPHGSRPLPKPKQSDKPKEPYILDKENDPMRMN